MIDERLKDTGWFICSTIDDHRSTFVKYGLHFLLKRYKFNQTCLLEYGIIK